MLRPSYILRDTPSSKAGHLILLSSLLGLTAYLLLPNDTFSGMLAAAGELVRQATAGGLLPVVGHIGEGALEGLWCPIGAYTRCSRHAAVLPAQKKQPLMLHTLSGLSF